MKSQSGTGSRLLLVGMSLIMMGTSLWAELPAQGKKVAPAAGTSRKRAVRIPTAAASLAGTIVDSMSGAPLSGVSVSALDKRATSETDGRYSLTELRSGQVQIVVEQFGYETATRNTTLVAGLNTVNFSLNPRPVVLVTDSSQVVRRVDFDSLQFGYSQGLIGYRTSLSANVCRTAGVAEMLEKSQIASISGPSTMGGSCCTNGQQVSFVLKNGQSFPATFTDSCAGYLIDLIGRDRTTGGNVFIPFTQITRAEFP